MKGYHPLAGGFLDDASPLTWTKVFVHLKEPNLLIVSETVPADMDEKDWGILLDGLKYKKIKFAVLPSQRQSLVDLRAAIVGLCDKMREIPEEASNGGLFTGILKRVGFGGGRHTYDTMA
ncbi:hypothetical protein NSK_001802 [Nannochloropsis salina CCMP1776]|uniref:Uncharacterized protein n=1 Tax=Nannochloropsis salina CCMP1776 TaxID=1027361 RepID=A0A4D9D6R5_9STRA|nr:hypothetical protein NSK_001802 [Nannochloropsis salina CCMP1776]|eukprot:TFJ86714.1 hypothetical protein NSK_001802 [Nannochloropsis salina CCMP1776]